ncbi:mediator of RNA polymerase II transcription subunit 13 [Curvularia kusanoi]|uniref:Mediator of RNA polymerase II transcription subunit 13 n=1 Tax=Curvularia kusanoi TaxID=90978 RepID=A0A9P4W6Z4_CURKU|nr:mediator of RNA polymerase II transcription subunit 13 [Curvularia kusanoi]
MEFLRNCLTNAQAIGDFEAVAYQAFSVARSTTETLRDWSPDEDTSAVEAALRERQLLVARDPTRPWLWLFTPATVDKAGASPADLPDLTGYTLQREQHGFTKALEFARPPSFVRYPTAASHPALTAAQNRAAASRQAPTASQPTAAEQPPPLSADAVYDLFTSSVVALITLSLVKACAVVSLNCRTFISKPAVSPPRNRTDSDGYFMPHWLSSIDVHWASAGTLIVSTFTERVNDMRSLDEVPSHVELTQLVGTVVRVAPNGMLGRIMSFDDPVQLVAEDTTQRPRRKRARRSNLEQSIDKWKNTVRRWLAWKGYSLPNLDQSNAWVRVRTAFNNTSTSPNTFAVSTEQDVLWPRALCYYYAPSSQSTSEAPLEDPLGASNSVQRWFEGIDSVGYRDPYDVAQEWFVGKAERDKSADAQRKAKKAEEDALRRKEENPGLFPSSPVNTRTGAYGELQPVSGVYPTPPDGVAPGAPIFASDTPSVSGTASNVILAPGGTNPAINLSAPQDIASAELTQQVSATPAFAADSESGPAANNNDDLFGDDMDEGGYEENAVGDDDFDFFDGPNDGDVDMADAPPPAETKVEAPQAAEKEEQLQVGLKTEDQESTDPLAALEEALSTSVDQASNDALPKTENKEDVAKVINGGQSESHNSMRTEMQERQPPVAKAPTPPLSPSKVRDTLKASPNRALTIHIPPVQSQDRRGSSFGPLAFSRKMSVADAKYQDGRYGVHPDVKSIEASTAKSASARPKSLRDVPLLTKFRYAAAVASATTLPKITPSIQGLDDYSEDESGSESESSDVSDEDAEEVETTIPAPFSGGPITLAKRKLPTDGNATPLSVTSFAESFGGDLLEMQTLHLDDSSLLSFEPSSWDWPLVKLPPPIAKPCAGVRYSMPLFPNPVSQVPDTPTSQPDLSYDIPDEKPASGSDTINIAQMVTEQVISATLDILEENVDSNNTGRGPSEMRWAKVIKDLFPKAVDCALPALAAINDVFPELSAQAKGQQRVPPRKANETPAVPGGQIYPINPPFIRVRRAETPWDLLPPAVTFWEPLGLAPVNGPKNVVAFCIYPHSDSLRPSLESFLLHMQLAYDSCKLGAHTRVETVSEYENGLVPCRIDTPAAPRAVYKALRETCVKLGKMLATRHANIREQLESRIDAFIIYMVNPFEESSALWELCASFWTLFQTYGQGSVHPSQPQKPDLVLQIIPIKYIASFDHPVILSSNTYINLAREVYNRSPPSAEPADKLPLPIASAPAFQLEEPSPRNVPFKLQSDPPQDLLRENSYMHLGYAVSLDGTWLTAAWTDACGKSQATSTYHIGTRSFNEIAKEIWVTTISILQARKVTWRVCVARAGAMDREEFETWAQLITCPTSLNLFVTLITVDARPPYKFNPGATSVTAQSNPNTPAATPGAGVSPDPTIGLTPAATPSAVDPPVDPTQDPDARLVDVTDETWGVILAHRLNNSNSTSQFSPAMISGLIVKRGPGSTAGGSLQETTDAEQGPIAIAVNILWIGAVGSTRPATTPFPPTPGGSEPPAHLAAGSYLNNAGSSSAQQAGSSTGQPNTPTQGPQQTMSCLMFTGSPQTRNTAENLLKEILQQFRGLGLLARLRGMKGSRHGTADDQIRQYEFLGKDRPPYAILSHTWGNDGEEVLFEDIRLGTGRDKTGYQKLRFCASQARNDGLDYFWVDTCCIDKPSSTELGEAINSMFKWYRDAARCYAYLSDVSAGAEMTRGKNKAFHESRWFTRGWTLQELLAPKSVEFFSKDGQKLGDKTSLSMDIQEITGIPPGALEGGYASVSRFSVEERLSWAEGRDTKREEDAAYSLLGLFGLCIPLLYGEEREGAFRRLHRERDIASAFEKAQVSTIDKENGDNPKARALMAGDEINQAKRTASQAFGNYPEESIERDTNPDSLERRAQQMRTWWDQGVMDHISPSRNYVTVAVLMLKWSDDLDEPEVREDVNRLEAVFRDRYHFRTLVVGLDASRKPHHQLVGHVSRLIQMYDSPSSLLIVFYSGNSRYNDLFGRLELILNPDPFQRPGMDRPAVVRWHKAEEMLSDEAVESDILVLLDTTYTDSMYENLRVDTGLKFKRLYEMITVELAERKVLHKRVESGAHGFGEYAWLSAVLNQTNQPASSYDAEQ